MLHQNMIELGDLKPNPFKKQIQGGRLDSEKVKRLEESINQDGFWTGIHARKNDGNYEIAFGHHRLQAAINVLGKNYKTSIQLDDYTDAQMVRMLVNENSASEGASDAEQIDAVVMARKWLRSHPEECKLGELYR
jgi:ParB-like chromosome segregation protein Spo0J